MASPRLRGFQEHMPARVSGTAAKHDILIELGEAIRSQRRALGLSQEELAHRTGIDRSHMGKIERGERNVTLLNIERVATELQIRPSALLAQAGF